MDPTIAVLGLGWIVLPVLLIVDALRRAWKRRHPF
jgi:hypothetical protein